MGNINILNDKLQIILDSKKAIQNSLSGVIDDKVSKKITKYSEIIDNLGPVNDKINFRDYDGSLIHSYTKKEFLELESLPELPYYDNITCQGWNYTLEDAKAYVQDYGLLDIGATYQSADGKTRLYIDIENECTIIPIHYYQSVAKGVTIEWGDGESDSLDGTGDRQISHVYMNPGKYVISLTVNSGTVRLGHKTASCNVLGLINTTAVASLYKVEIGAGLTTIDNYAFQCCTNLESICIPENITSIGQYAFYNCAGLFGVVLSKNLKTVGNYAFTESGLNVALLSQGITSIGQYAFNNCYSLEALFIPKDITTMGVDAFYNCYSLETVTIPEGFTTISNYMFYNCKNLNKINIPSTVTSIGTYAFYECNNLKDFEMSSVASIGSYAFYNCYRLNTSIPNITTINEYTFYNCADLNDITIPNSVTSIGNYAFYGCSDLNIKGLSNSLTSIGSNAFYNCKSMQIYDFTSYTSIPSLSNTGVFEGIPGGCEIRVPASLYTTWKTYTNWSNFNHLIVPVGDNIKFFITNSENNNFKKYYFEEGMTWETWFNSIYNVKGFTIDNFISEINGADAIIEKNIYIIKMGVYIVSLDGGLYEASEWTAGSNAMGVALITDNVSIVIAPDEWYASGSNAWNGNTRSAWGGYSKTVTDIMTTTTLADAITDFSGRRNTDMIISQLSGTTDSYSSYYTGAPAAEYCRAYTRGNKESGSWYLPAAGEMNEILKFKTDINTTLSKISGKTLGANSYTWTSTQYSNNNAWRCYWSSNTHNNTYKYSGYGVRPISQLNSDIRIINFSIDGTIYQAEEGMDWAWWIGSIYNTSGYAITNILGASRAGIVQENVDYQVISNGIYVVYSDGTYDLADNMPDATLADSVTGIGLVTDKVNMIVALDEWYSNSSSTAWNGNTRSAWGGYGTEVTGCFMGSSGYLDDFNGEANTDAIIAQLSGTTDGQSGYTGAPAAEYCRAYSKGYKGVGEWYLPAAGELNEIVLNKDAINAVLTKLGKNSLSKNSYTWSSSQFTSYYAWYYHWNNSHWNYTDKYYFNGVRPVCAF